MSILLLDSPMLFLDALADALNGDRDEKKWVLSVVGRDHGATIFHYGPVSLNEAIAMQPLCWIDGDGSDGFDLALEEASAFAKHFEEEEAEPMYRVEVVSDATGKREVVGEYSKERADELAGWFGREGALRAEVVEVEGEVAELATA